MKGMHKMFEEPMLFLKGAVVFAIGTYDDRISYLVLAMIVDGIFGVLVAVKKKEFKFSILVNKFFTKTVIYLLWIMMSHAFDEVAGLPDTARWSVTLVLAGLEVFSAIKNTSKLGYGELAEALESVYIALMKNMAHSKGGNKRGKSTTKRKSGTTRKKKSEPPTSENQSE